MDSTALRHWDDSTTAPLLFESAVLVDSSEYTVNYVQGKFEWTDGDPGVGTYTIDAVTLPTSYLTGGQSWTVDADVDMLETTSFSTTAVDPQWRTFIPGLSNASVGIDRLISTGTTGPVFFDRLNLEAKMVVELVFTGADRLEGYGYIDADSVSASVDGLTDESVGLTIDGPLYRSTT